MSSRRQPDSRGTHRGAFSPLVDRSAAWNSPLLRKLFALVCVAALVHDASLFLVSPAAAQEATTTGESGAAGKAGHHEETAEHEAGEGHAGGHSDPVAPVLLAIILILLAAKVGGDLFERVGMPAVLGELAMGILLGNFAMLTGLEWFDFLHAPQEEAVGSVYNTGAMIKVLSSIGVVLLLFEVGLESTVREMMAVGVSSFIVAVLGVVTPMALGYGVTRLLHPEGGWQVATFIGATLCATSVGITARVLRDLGRSQDKESQIILGAAVIDDILGLMVLAIVSGIIVQTDLAAQGGDEDTAALMMSLVKIILLAVGFLAGALALGAARFPRAMFRTASTLRGHGLLVVTALLICFGFAWMANKVGLAPIVGAFAAGLILEGAHYEELGKRENRHLEDALAPLTAVLVPIFFVEMGIEVRLESFQDPSVWGLAAAITVVAIIGKQVCSFGVREQGLNRLAVGLGMIPRGEVGLIFANEGRKLVSQGEPVISAGTYSAVVVMVMLTTIVTPPLLKWSMVRGEREP